MHPDISFNGKTTCNKKLNLSSGICICYNNNVKLLPGVQGNKSSNTLASGNSMVPKKNFVVQNM